MLDPQQALPSSLEAESAILGAVLVHAEAYYEAARTVGPADFYRDAHRKIFAAMGALVDRHAAIDFTTLCEELRRTGLLDDVGGPAYVSGLVTGVPRKTNVRHYADIVKEKSALRGIIAEASRLLTAAQRSDPSLGVIEHGVKNLLGVARTTRDIEQIGDAVKRYMTDIDERSEQSTVMFGMADLDALLGGLRAGQLVIVAARPSVGKTSFALAVSDNVTATGTAVGVFSLETQNTDIAAQTMAFRSGVSSEAVRRRQVQEHQWSRIAQAVESLRETPLYVADHVTTMTQVRACAHRLKAEHDVRVIVVDYIQLLANPQAHDLRQEVSYVSRSLKLLARDLNVCVIGLSQLKRDVEGRKDKRPMLSDLRESGALEQDADLVLLLYREEMYKNDSDAAGTAEVIVAKNRSGPVGVVRMAFNKELARFRDLARLDEDQNVGP